MRAELWDIAVALYKASLATQEEVEKWNRHAMTFASHKLENNVLHIDVEDEYLAEFYQDLYASKMRFALIQGGADENVQVKFRATDEARELAEMKRQEKARAEMKEMPAAATTEKFESTNPFFSNYTFENFVKGPSNSFAYAIATAVANSPGGNTNNPFFIWGGTGLGKTHLMQAVGHHIMEHNPDKRVCYITSETFLNEFVNSLSTKTTEAFRNRYRNIDVLLLDDVQFVGGTNNFQEEFFNTFNNLISRGRQIVMTSDVPPRKLNRLEERLISRFQQGIVIEIELPSYETRLAILRSKTRNSRRPVPDDILMFIAENIKSSVRAVEGALKLVEQFMGSNPGIELTKQTAMVLLKELTEEEVTIRRLSVEEIIKAVGAFYEASYADILSASRTQPLATARQVAMFLARKLTGQSTPTVAAEFKRNHTTVIYGAETIQKRLSVEPKLKRSIEMITEQLGRKPSELFE